MNIQPDEHLEAAYDEKYEHQGDDDRDCTGFDTHEESTGWPGDGSGTDDLADFNSNEANDYYGE